MDSLCDRKQLLKNWDDIVKLPRPKLELQGSDPYIKKQWKYCWQWEIGWFQMKHIISALAEMDERPMKTKRQITLNGWDREDEEEERKPPSTREQLKRAHWCFATPCSCVRHHFPSLLISTQRIKTWRIGMHSSGGRTLQRGSHLPARQSYCMLRGTHGDKSTTKSTREQPSKTLCHP